MHLNPWARSGAYVLSGVLAVGLLMSVAAGRSSGQASQAPTIKETPCVAIASVEGKDNFENYCAVCHGATGKGNGPAAPALKAPLPDLTTMASRHGGTFNTAAVERLISGADKRPAAHGTVAMPIWGPVFHGAESDAGVTRLRIQNLAKYLESIQQK